MPSNKAPTRAENNSDSSNSRKKKIRKSTKRTVSYGLIFFYSFSCAFIVFGIIAVLVFVYNQNPAMFGLARQNYDTAVQAIAEGDYDKAEELLQKCLVEDPSDSDAQLKLAEVYIMQQRYDDALSYLNNAVLSTKNSTNYEFYKLTIKTYVMKGDLPGALNFINSMTSLMRTGIAQFRPDAVTADNPQGSYDSGLKIVLTVPEDCAVYYTTDGNLPSFDSPEYVAGTEIEIPVGTTTLRAVAVSTSGYISEESVLQYSVYNDNTAYEFLDAKFEAMVRYKLNRASGTVYYKDLNRITSLSTDGVISNKKIKNLGDIVSCPNIKELDLTGESEIDSLSVLSSLQSLTSLNLCSCNITDSELAAVLEIRTLLTLNLSSNEITNISMIGSLDKLTNLNLSDNNLTSVSSLAQLSGLKSLNLSDNKLEGIAGLSTNKLLSNLNISNNLKISSLDGISNLNALQTFRLSGTSVSDLSQLKTLFSLTNLDISSTAVTSVAPLALISSLSTLTASGTAISDYSALSTSKIKNLTASNAAITDLTAIASISSIEVLNVSSNTILSVAHLTAMPYLKTLKIGHTYVTDFELLANCQSLTFIDCTGCTISSATMDTLSAAGITVAS